MREFGFTLRFDRGDDELTDRFAAHEGVWSQALVCSLSDGREWRLEQVSGPAAALDEVRPLLLDSARGCESVSETPCDAAQYHDVLEDRATKCTVYSLFDGVERCHTVPSLATRYLELGTVCHLRRRGAKQHWRILTREEHRVGLLFETIHEKLREGITFQFDYMRDATWTTDIVPSTSIPGEQHEALEAAIAHGYYETPREITLDDLAEKLGVPRSTLSYRLRRAEARLAKRYIEGSEPGRS